MNRLPFALVAILLLGIAGTGPLLAQEIEATVDRTELARGETLTLTLRVFGQRQGPQLDLTPLTGDFEVLGTRTSSQIRSINGSVESWTDYIVTLFPLAEGELEIPSLIIHNSRTEPIAISVTNQGPRSNQAGEELFLDLEVSKQSVYVQEQLLFTVRLFYTINGIRNPWFTELEVPDTVIQPIGSPRQYEQVIDGVRHGVYEKRYVLFPQRSGPLVIPDMLFRGEVTDSTSNFVFRNLNTRRITAFTEGLTIEVKERPAASRNSAAWLPASHLSLQQTFDRDLQDLQVGDSVVRTLTLRAEGLDGAVLPPFGDMEISGAKIYPNPPAIDRSLEDGRMVGTRTEQSTVVATASGTVEIPAVSIPWWNVDSDQPETVALPATRIEIADVAGAVPAEQTVASGSDIGQLPASPPAVAQDRVTAQAQAELIAVNGLWLYLFIALMLLILAFSLHRLLLARQRAGHRWLASRRRQIASLFAPHNNETVAFHRLQRACHCADLTALRETLIVWCNHFFGTQTITNTEDILRQQQAPALHPFVRAIQSQLFDGGASGSEELDRQALLQTVSGLRKGKAAARKASKRQERYALPPLYRT